MKKSDIFLAALVCMMIQTVSTFANDRIIPAEQLPSAAKNFILKNFPGQGISYAKMDVDYQTTYEVRLNNGVKLEFDKKGKWEKVNCNYNAVPANLVPTAIAKYVKTNFADTQIVTIDKEFYGYDVELSNDFDLKFNHHGHVLEYGK